MFYSDLFFIENWYVNNSLGSKYTASTSFINV